MTSEPFFVMVLKEAYGIKINLFFFYSYLWQWPLNKDQMQLKVKLHFITCSGKKILLVLFNVQLHWGWAAEEIAEGIGKTTLSDCPW